MFLLALVACTSWIDQRPACKYDVYEWSDDLLAHILTGEGDGAFDYDPEDVPRQKLTGSYKPASGNFAWEAAYAQDYWLHAAEVSGYGTAYHNGNLDVLYTETLTDALGEVSSTEHRVYRKGCSVVTDTWITGDEQNAIERTGEYDSDDSYHWEADIPGYHFQGGMRRNLSTTFNQDAENGTYSESYAWSPDGTAEGVWSGDCVDTGCNCDASYLVRFDGGEESDIHITCDGEPYAEYHGIYEYSGAGTAHYDYADGSTCDLISDDDGSCRYTCSDGSQGNC
jgi:hypothetical protein